MVPEPSCLNAISDAFSTQARMKTKGKYGAYIYFMHHDTYHDASAQISAPAASTFTGFE